MILKLTMLVLVAAALSGCITPQNLYKHRMAEGACGASDPPRAAQLGCLAGEAGPIIEAGLGGPRAS